MQQPISAWLKASRSLTLVLLAAALLVVIAFAAPQQLKVVAYKLALVTLAAVIGYWVDRLVFPYARPDGYLCEDWRHGTDEPSGDVDYAVIHDYRHVFMAAQIRRAIILGSVVLAMALGL